MGVFHHFSKIFLVLKSSPFLLDPDPDPDPDPYCFCLDPDPYQSSPWIRIHNEFFHILDPDPYQNDTDPQHWKPVESGNNLVVELKEKEQGGVLYTVQ